MHLKKTLFALGAAAMIAAGMTAAGTSSAEAGWKGHRHWHHKRFVFVPAYHPCFWKAMKVWTHRGPIWVSRRVCY